MLYQAYQLQSDLMSPMRATAQYLSQALWLEKTERSVMRKLAAACDVFSRLRLTHTRPAYGIDRVLCEGREIPVVEEVALTMPFGTLLHFRKDDSTLPAQPTVLLVAPLSGHFATLLRETARTLLQDHDVYITDCTTPAMCRSATARSPWTTTSPIWCASRKPSVPACTWWPSASPAWPRWQPRR